MNQFEKLMEKDEKERQEILERNKEFHDKCIQKIKDNKDKKKPKVVVTRCAGGAFALTMVLCCFIFPAKDQFLAEPATTPVYNSIRVTETFEITNWADESNSFIFTLDDYYVQDKNEKISDSETGDTLYLYLKCTSQDSLNELMITLYPNPYFREEKGLGKNIHMAELSGYTLSYSETVTDYGGIYGYDCVGLIEEGNDIVYITYSETSMSEQSGFISFVEQTIQKK